MKGRLTFNMKAFVIIAVIMGLVLVAGLVMAGISTEDVSEDQEQISCSTCENVCSTNSNCGLSTCGAVSGTGSCRCDR